MLLSILFNKFITMYGIVNYKDKHFDKRGPNTF